MCGIIGYVGKRQIVPVIMEGLRRLEYRGYDSAGIAVAGNGEGLQIRRAEGKLRNLQEAIRRNPLDGTYGVGHTRWATHGHPTEQNAHPHRDCTGRVVVVHNGIIENYAKLKKSLQVAGHRFVSQTDSEVIAHLVEKHLFGDRQNGAGKSLEDAVREALKELAGVLALAVIAVDEPDKIVAARNGPPAVIGLGKGEYFVASDAPAILNHTRDLVFLADGDVAVITPSGVTMTDFNGSPIERLPQRIAWDPLIAEKGGFRHFMLKEIYEQPRAVRDTCIGRVFSNGDLIRLEDLNLTDGELRALNKINIAACGTSWHAGLVGKYMIEQLARVPVDVEHASEFRYRDPILGPDSLSLLITQSGETADTLAAQREAKSKGAKTISLCNVVGATATREAYGTIYTHAGLEVGVASTKSFTAQMTALLLFALHLADKRGAIGSDQVKYSLAQLLGAPAKLESILAHEELYERLAKEYWQAQSFLYLGRGIHYPVALEGALKLKELSYIHAEGYPAGEMKHGPNALIDECLPVVIVATCDRTDPHSVLRHEKTLSNLKEVKARSGRVIAIATEGDEEIAGDADHVIYLPPAPELISPILESVPLQLLAYHIALLRDCDVDQPRNLAKSVTVE